MFRIMKGILAAACAGLCCFGAEAGTAGQVEKDAQNFAAVSVLLPSDGTVYRIVNVRNFKFYCRRILEKLVQISAENGTPPDMDAVTALWDMLGLGAVDVIGMADKELSAENNVWETLCIVYSGEPLSGLVHDTFRGKFDTLKAAGSWPASTVFGCRFNIRLVPAARAVHENIEPLPTPAVEICKALSGRYSILAAEDEKGPLLDVIIPDNEASFVYLSLYAALAGSEGVRTGKNRIFADIPVGNSVISLVIYQHKNMVRICNGDDVPARIRKLPKLRDDADFLKLTAGAEAMGDSVFYAGAKILNPLWAEEAGEGNFSVKDIFLPVPFDCRTFSTSSFKDFGMEFRSRSFGSYQRYIIENMKLFLQNLSNNVKSMKQGGYHEIF